MWIFTSNTFVSIVEHRDDPSMLCVRGRFAGDAARFLGLPPEAEEVTPQADYRFRCYAHREHVMDAVASAVRSIDYGNFKDSIEEPWRADVAMSVWSTMWRAQGQQAAEPAESLLAGGI